MEIEAAQMDHMNCASQIIPTDITDGMWCTALNAGRPGPVPLLTGWVMRVNYPISLRLTPQL